MRHLKILVMLLFAVVALALGGHEVFGAGLAMAASVIVPGRRGVGIWAENRLLCSSANEDSAMQGVYSQDYPPEYLAYSAQYKNKLDIIGWKWWDTKTYVSTTTLSLINWFGVVNTTPDVSNMEIANAFAAPKAFYMRAIRMFIKQRPRSIARAASTNPNTGALDNVAQLINGGVFTLTIGNKLFVQEPIWALTAGGGATGIIALEGATADPGGAIDYAQNGIADPRAVHTLLKPIFMQPQINFSGAMTWPAALTLTGNVDIQIVLEGDLLRPVQ